MLIYTYLLASYKGITPYLRECYDRKGGGGWALLTNHDRVCLPIQLFALAIYMYTTHKCCDFFYNASTRQPTASLYSSYTVLAFLFLLLIKTSGLVRVFSPESIELFIEDQAFSPSYDLAPPPSLSPSLPSASCPSLIVFLCVAGNAYWWGGGGGVGALSDDGEKVWSAIYHSIRSVSVLFLFKSIASCMAWGGGVFTYSSMSWLWT